WAILLKSEGKAMGMINYLGGTAIPGLGYIINRDYWGQGITVEAGKLALDFGYSEMNLDRVELWIDQYNVQSQRVAEKMGFKLKGQLAQKYAHEENHHIMYTYGLWREQFYGKPPVFDEPRVFQVQPVLMTEDVQTAVNYYRDTLGFNVDFVFGDPVQHAGVSFRNWTGQGVTLQLTTKRQGQDIQVSSYLYIFTDAKIDQLYEMYIKREVEIMRQPETFPWGMREFTIRDLNGHVLVFGTQA
ncbi:MAG: GNAT family N-acetyltransferase, partial [Chloroflexota bacterium]